MTMKTGFIISVLLLLTLAHDSHAQEFDGWFYETANGRTLLPKLGPRNNRINMPDGRVVTFTTQRMGKNYEISLKAQPDSDILKWGVAVAASPKEYFTG